MRALSNADWSFPIPIRYGPGRLKELASICRDAGMKRPLVVTDRGSRELPFIGAALGILSEAGLTAALFADLSPNPTDREVASGRQFAERGGFDGVVAIGGGSGMDGGKAISLTIGADDGLWAYDYDLPPQQLPQRNAFCPIICIPTTAGTGAETDSTAMITDTARGIKGCVWHPLHKPAAALLDPELTVALPARMTAWTGLDALVHAIEAYCVPVWHPMCDGIALEAIELIWQSLPTAVAEPDNLAARGSMLVGSCMAGVAFLNGLGLVHAISHMVGAAHGTHHGLTNAVLLPIVLEFNRDAISDRVPKLCRAMSLAGQDFGALHAAICEILDRHSIPTSLSALGIENPDIDTLALKASRDPAAATNPRRASLAELQELIASAFTRAR